MDEHSKKRLDLLSARLEGLELRVEKLDRLVYKLFKRLPKGQLPERQTGEPTDL